MGHRTYAHRLAHPPSRKLVKVLADCFSRKALLIAFVSKIKRGSLVMEQRLQGLRSQATPLGLVANLIQQSIEGSRGTVEFPQPRGPGSQSSPSFHFLHLRHPAPHSPPLYPHHLRLSHGAGRDPLAGLRADHPGPASYVIARDSNAGPPKTVLEHIVVAAVVILVSEFPGRYLST
jgi:hypothetical protein